MSYKIENINGCTKKLIFDFETMDLSSKVKSALVKKQQTVSIKGFRKGKAPLTVIEKMYRSQIENEALYEFITDQYSDAVQKESLHPISYPSFSNTKYESGKSVSFEAIVEIFPEFELNGLDELSFPKETPTVEEKEIESLRNHYLDSKSEMVEIKDAEMKVAKGLYAVVNFAGSLEDGEFLPQLKGEDILVDVGQGKFLPDFEEGLIGMKKGEKKNIPVQFPESYQDEKLQGKKVNFDLELLELKQKNMPEFTDELTKEFGYDSVEDFRSKAKENIFLQKEKEIRQTLFKQILDSLIEKNKFDIPNTMLLRQKESLQQDLENTLKRQGFNNEMVKEYFDKWEQEMTEKAEFQVRSGLILDNLAKKHKIETLEEDLENKYKEISKTSGIVPEEIKKYYTTNEELRKNLFYTIREEKTFNKLLELIN